MDAVIDSFMKGVMKVIEWTLTAILLVTVGTVQFVVRKIRETRAG